MVNRDKLKHRISRNANPDLVIREPMDIFQQHMREIEDEMIEEYFYTTDNPRANSSPAYEIITLVLDYVCEFTHPNVYRVYHILLHVLSPQE